jgi:hypothetical protein
MLALARKRNGQGRLIEINLPYVGSGPSGWFVTAENANGDRVESKVGKQEG